MAGALALDRRSARRSRAVRRARPAGARPRADRVGQLLRRGRVPRRLPRRARPGPRRRPWSRSRRTPPRSTRPCTRDLVAAFTERRRGTAPVRSRRSSPGNTVYASSKVAIARAVRGRVADWGARGVRINAVAPGPFMSPLLQQGLDDPTFGPLIEALPVPTGAIGTPGRGRRGDRLPARAGRVVRARLDRVRRRRHRRAAPARRESERSDGLITDLGCGSGILAAAVIDGGFDARGGFTVEQRASYTETTPSTLAVGRLRLRRHAPRHPAAAGDRELEAVEAAQRRVVGGVAEDLAAAAGAPSAGPAVQDGEPFGRERGRCRDPAETKSKIGLSRLPICS